MAFIARCLLLSAVSFGTVFSTPIQSSVEHKIFSRQNDGPFAVTGAASGGVQPRLEVQELRRQPEAWNLFLLALERFKAMNQDIETSYYQICGIHGEPTIPWDGVQPIGNENVGYCPHSSNLFGPWHKPYLALFEQVLSDRAQEIAQEFPAGDLHDRYVQAAGTLRLPYWDWAMRSNENGIIYPALFSNPTAAVTFSNGSQGNIPNPLLRYDFHPLVPGDLSPPWNQWTRTGRQPVSNRNPNSPDRHDRVEAALSGGFNQNRNEVYQILSQFQTFNEFSNTASEQTNIGNLEQIHNRIHGAFGSGHMGFPSVAAFDPIFWLHHANVDRIMLLFQAIYPDTYVTPAVQQGATFMNNPGDIWDAQTPLWPFHSNTAGDFHTSDTARPINAYGYTYPELLNSPSNETLRSIINTLYGPRTMSIAKRQSTNTNVTEQPEHRPRAYLAVIDAPIALSGTYSIDIFLGSISTPLEDWVTDPNFVGSQVYLSNPAVTNNEVVTGSVILTEALEDAFSSGLLADLSQESIESYLREHLHWRVEQNGQEVGAGDVPGFRVTIRSVEVQMPERSTDFPRYVGEYRDHLGVTRGRVGGAE